MRIKGTLHEIDPKTRGYELDGLLTNWFGQGAFVLIYVDPKTRQFFATDEQKGHMIPVGYQLFSAGQVGISQVQKEPEGTK